MLKAKHSLLILGLLIVVSPLQGQALSTAADYYNRGFERRKAGDLDGAIADYTKAIEIEPRFPGAHLGRGNARQAKGDLDGAIADYTKGIELNPRDAGAYTNRGLAKRRKGDLDGAISDSTRAIELDPRLAVAYTHRGNAREKKGDHDGAIADHTKAIDLDPRLAAAYGNRGNARKVKGELDGASADYTKAIELDPQHAGAYNNLAWLLATTYKDTMRNGRLAVEHARKAAELTKWQTPQMLGTLAAAYAESGNFDEAIKWQTKALEFPEYDKKHGEDGRKRLQLYRERKPFHEQPPK